MDTNELKKLLKGSTTVLILEDGEPSFVILGYDAYKNLIAERPAALPAQTGEVDVPLRRGDNETGLNERQHRDPEPSRQSGSYGAGRDGQFRERVGEKESELLEKINKQILSLKGDIEKEEKGATNPRID